MVGNLLKLLGSAALTGAFLVACGGGGGGSSDASQEAPSDRVSAPQLLTATQSPRVGIGLKGFSYYDRSFALADAARHAQARGMDWSYDVAGDADGYPGKDFQLIFSSTKVGAGTYKLSFTGRATLTAGGAGRVQNASYDTASNTSKADFVLANDATGNVWVVFKDTYRNKASSKGDGVTNIHLWRPGYATDGSATFTTEFIAAMQKFRIIRGMEFLSVNTNPQSTWAERTLPSHFGSTYENGSSLELLVALANVANRDVWLNVPVRADDDYIRKLAQLVKYGSDGRLPYTSAQANPAYAPLKPGLRVYLEYGNEVWNSGAGFKGYGWALALANANKGDTTHPIAFDGPLSDQYIALRRWVAYRSAFISLTFRDVFGDNAMMTTVRPILASQVGNANSFLSMGLTWAQAFYGQVRTNPLNAVARKPSDIWYGGGGAAYYASDLDPKDSSSATLDSYFANLPSPSFAKTSAIDSMWTHAYGLKYVAYEGGPGPGFTSLGSASGAAVSAAFNNDPRMKGRMLLAQDIWDQAGGDELVYYVYSGSSPWSFTNELAPQVVSDTGSFKLQAVDAINAKPQPAATLGTLVPATINLKDPASQTIGSDAAAWALGGTAYLLRIGATNPAPYILLPIRTAAAGTRQISLNVGTIVTGSVALYVNGKSAGAITLAPAAITSVTSVSSNGTVAGSTTTAAAATTATSSKVTVNLPAGLSVLRLDAPQGSGDIFIKEVVVQ